MRKLSWIAVAVCAFALPMCAQSRHRGYQAAGGWHRKVVAASPLPKQSKKPNDKRTTPPPPPSSPSR